MKPATTGAATANKVPDVKPLVVNPNNKPVDVKTQGDKHDSKAAGK